MIKFLKLFGKKWGLSTQRKPNFSLFWWRNPRDRKRKTSIRGLRNNWTTLKRESRHYSKSFLQNKISMWKPSYRLRLLKSPKTEWTKKDIRSWESKNDFDTSISTVLHFIDLNFTINFCYLQKISSFCLRFLEKIVIVSWQIATLHKQKPLIHFFWAILVHRWMVLPQKKE